MDFAFELSNPALLLRYDLLLTTADCSEHWTTCDDPHASTIRLPYIRCHFDEKIIINSLDTFVHALVWPSNVGTSALPLDKPRSPVLAEVVNRHVTAVASL